MTTASLQTLNRIGKRLPCDVAYEQKFRLPQESVGIIDEIRKCCLHLQQDSKYKNVPLLNRDRLKLSFVCKKGGILHAPAGTYLHPILMHVMSCATIRHPI